MNNENCFSFRPDFNPEAALAQLDALVTQDKGSPLGERARADAAAMFQAAVPPRYAPFEFSMVQREVTVLWAKLRGISLGDAAAPEAIDLTSLNRCLARLIEVVAKFQGHIDQLSGDSIKVHFGAEAERADDVERAVLCAVEMQMAMRDLNAAQLRDRAPQIYMGIGVSTGSALTGRIGSEVFSRFAVIGEVVNLAFRLQAFSLRGQVLISEATYDRCWGLVSATAPMRVFVKGHAQPVSLRELVAIPTRKLKVPRQEFRRSHRVEVRMHCSYQVVRDGVVLPYVAMGTMRDMGYHGAMLELAEPLPLQSEVRLTFDLPLVTYQARDVYARVITIKSEAERSMVGLEFSSTTAEFDARVQAFVQMMVAAT